MQYDDSIIQDTAAEKEQDMCEVGVTMAAWGGIASSGMARRSRLHALERLRLARVPSNVKRLRAGLPEAVLPFVTRSPVRGGLG